MADEPMDVDGAGDGASQHGGGFDWAAPQDELDFYDTSLDNYGGRDSLIFAIDFSKIMFQQCRPKKEGKPVQSALQTTLQAVREAVVSRIYRSEQDFLSVVFYNTIKAQGTSFKSIYVFDELQRPGAEVVKKLDKMMEMEESEILAEFGSSDGSSVGDLLWACNAMFSKMTQKLFSRRILIFTVNDDPHRGNKAAINFAKQKASDIWENGIAVTVFALDLPGIPFDQSKFWDDVIVGNEDEDQRVAPMGDWEDLTAAISRKDHARRAMANITLSMGPGLEMAVSVFTLVRTATKAPPVKLYRKTHELVTVERTAMEEESASVLMPTDIKKYMSFAGKNIYFLPEEITEMKRFGPAGLRVIAFKPLTALKEKHHIRPAQFLYPNEANIRGSSKLFVALLTKCLEKRVMAVCQYIPRENISAKLVALVPQPEELGDEGQQVTPPGFHVVFFPYADDFRPNNPKPKDAPVADAEMIGKARELVKKLQFKYSPENFENPALHTHLKNIQVLALNQEIKTDSEGRRILDDFQNYVEPNVAGIERKAGRIMGELVELVYPADYDPVAGQAKKRTYAAKGAKEPVAKKGPAVGKAATRADDFAVAAENGTLKKYTVAQLKEYCKTNKVSVNGTKKDDYIGAIETHLAGND